MTGAVSFNGAQHPSRILLQCCTHRIEIEPCVNRCRTDLGMI
jgi:hypothetical protein